MKVNCQFPKPLRPGSKVRVISPAGPVDADALKQGVSRLKEWGYRVDVAPNALSRKDYLAGDDDSRSRDLVQALLNPEVEGIICSRGGYGSGRLLRMMPWELIQETPPKVFVGFSDVGALQVNLWARTGWITFSGPQVAKGFGGNLTPRTIGHFNGMIQGWNRRLRWNAGPVYKLKPCNPLPVEGTLIPICLSMLNSLIGTPWLPDLNGAVLCLEDVNEPLYRLDRMLWQLREAGIFDLAGGVILGNFLYNGVDIASAAAEVLLGFTEEIDLPVWGGMPYGHGEDRFTLPVGAGIRITEDGKIELATGEKGEYA